MLFVSAWNHISMYHFMTWTTNSPCCLINSFFVDAGLVFQGARFSSDPNSHPNALWLTTKSPPRVERSNFANWFCTSNSSIKNSWFHQQKPVLAFPLCPNEPSCRLGWMQKNQFWLPSSQYWVSELEQEINQLQKPNTSWLYAKPA